MILNLSFILFVIVILGGYIEDRPIISHIDGKKSHYLLCKVLLNYPDNSRKPDHLSGGAYLRVGLPE